MVIPSCCGTSRARLFVWPTRANCERNEGIRFPLLLGLFINASVPAQHLGTEIRVEITRGQNLVGELCSSLRCQLTGF
jgi:hypothetical protein